MDVRLVRGGADELTDVLGSLDASPDTSGIGVFAADGSLGREQLGAAVRELDTPVFGGVFPAVLHDGTRETDATVVAGLTTEPSVTVVPELSDPGTALDEHLPAATSVPDGGTAFVLVDAFASRVEEFVSELFAAYGVSLSYLGGGAGSLDAEGQPCLVTGDGLVGDGAVLATVDAPTSVGVQHGWEAVAGPFRVTAADGPRLAGLNGESAFAVYREIVEGDGDRSFDTGDFFEVAKRYPFGISRLDGEMIVRDPFEVDEDGVLTCFGDVPEEAFVHVLRGDEESLVEAAGEAAEQAAGGRDVLCFDCISRVLYLQDVFGRELDAIGGADEPTVGALTLGEIANDGRGHLEYYNKTVVVATTGAL
jgi:hypothetical protein